MASLRNDDHPATKIAQALGDIEPITKSVTPPLYPASTYQRDPDNQYRNGRVYARPHNPTFETAERLLTALEGGAASLLFSSGMAAATATFLALKPGDHVVAPEVMYWGLRNWLKGAATEWGLAFSFVDATDTQAFARALAPGRTKLVWLETPTNPTWGISDIAAIAKLAHDAGARVAVDSTVATPILTRPIELGADLVMHSGTKYLNGHSDLIAGTLTTAREDEYWERIKAVRSNVGAILGTFEAWLLQRGMRTLHLRVERASQSALKIAQHFAHHPLVAEVLYPGLPEFPGHALAARQMTGGFGGMLSIRTKGGEAAAVAVAAETRLWKRATSLGGVESLIEHRRSVEGPTSPVPHDLLRLSVGIEHADDLIADMEQALAIAHR
ncbi:cystathionine gamma-synthase [Aliidongia dinghuensis]|uniref:Cystathionine gamma-synthase n=1 Tax=Aliidongia dinghuensis TaxID=1867774 RepID=A0A8J2YTI5_9PROT|nr:PLP-dependent aspartate aminotransferase family protein [Aliidongia dinghuensis]GGF13218.1 cystathionine gamma-synthase [Aliidongia dinghuensis]